MESLYEMWQSEPAQQREPIYRSFGADEIVYQVSFPENKDEQNKATLSRIDTGQVIEMVRRLKHSPVFYKSQCNYEI